MMPRASLLFAVPPQRRLVGPSLRDAEAAARPRCLTDDQRRVITLAASRGRSLREIAMEFGVSHETVRSVILRTAEEVA